MDYIKIYNDLINRSINRTTTQGIYYEKHHIIPKCMGGLDDSINMTSLTYREHFIAHWLLHNIHNGNDKLELAFKFMAYGNGFIKSNKLIPSSRVLEENRLKTVKSYSTDNHKQKSKIGKKNKKTVTIDPEIFWYYNIFIP